MSDVNEGTEMIRLANGFEMPTIGFGTYPNTEDLITSIPTAIDCGYRLIDSSDNYGDESLVGKGIDNCGEDINDTVIVTKFSKPTRTYELEACFEESESAIGHKIDVYLLHWPYPHLWKDQWRRMEKLYLQGRCSAIGVCNFEEDKLEDLLRFSEVRPMVNQFERHPLFQQYDLAKLCHQEGIVTMSYSPMARMVPELAESDVLNSIATNHGRTISQVVMRWNLQHECIPIPASKSREHIKENYDVFDFVLDDAEMDAIDGMECGKRVRYDPKTRFSAKQKLRFFIYKLLKK